MGHRSSWWVVAGLVWCCACGEDLPGQQVFGGAGSGGGAGQPGAGNGGGDPDTGPAPGSDLPVNPGGDGAAGGGGNVRDPSEPCAAASVEAQHIEHEIPYEVTEEVVTSEPVTFYLMVDRSSSMRGNRWTQTISGLQGFINAPESAGVDVALSYFPRTNFAVFDSCNGSEYVTPDVPLGRLPGHAATLDQSLSTRQPDGLGTPIEPALRGMTEFCRLQQQQNPDQRCIGVFVGDGAPFGCSGDYALLTGIVADAQQNHDIMTFAIGIDGADYTLMNAIAEAGDTDCDPGGPNRACNAGFGEGLLQALNAIREQVTETTTRIETRIETEVVPLECEFGVPEPPPGDFFQKNQLNVLLAQATGDAQTFTRVDAEADCDEGADGSWHYDDLDNPNRILLCPDTCDRVTEIQNARIDIELGCEVLLR